MFTIETRQIGPIEGTETLTDYILSNPDTGEWAAVLPGFGGILRQLVLRKGDTRYKVVDSPASAQALLADETYASALMFPFASRVRHGIYQFEGIDYVLPLNEVMRDNALHGFVHQKPFRVIHQEANLHHASLTIQFNYTGDVPGYPFPFSLVVTYSLSAQGLGVTFKASNTGSTRCPAAFGWHPYFTLNNAPVDEMELTLPVRAIVDLDQHMIPTGKRPVPADRLGMFAMQDVQLDTPFEAQFSEENGKKEAVTTLRWPEEDVALELTQSDSLPYIVVYTPLRRDSIAIEPQTANVNAFNNGEGLTVLNPGDELQGSINVRLI
ncbi:aldose 1-epimerase [Fibrella sp. WM1]|uniref:aldose 1-epimerase n=1 Tax=Fibrella musci TaxID=3242485 RepID=UPI00352048A1